MSTEKTQKQGNETGKMNDGCCSCDFEKIAKMMENCCSDQTGSKDCSAIMKEMMQSCCRPGEKEEDTGRQKPGK